MVVASKNRPWTLDEIDDAHDLEWDVFKFKYPDRSYDGWRIKRGRTTHSGRTQRLFESDKRVGDLDFFAVTKLAKQMQEMKAEASYSQDEANIFIDTKDPVCVVGLSDTHIGSWGTDYGLFEEVTREIIETPNLYVALLGDVAHMAVKLRGVLEVSDNLLPPELQMRFVEAWIDTIKHKILFSTWDNHAVMREEDAVGYSMYADILKRRVVYHNGIGHPNVLVGNQTYAFAVSHFFRGRSENNPCHGLFKYLIRDGHKREIAMAGDSHVPGLLHFTHGGDEKLAINAGTIQTNSGYAKRFYSLTTHPRFPCVVLHPDEHRFTGLWRVRDFVL